MVYGFTGTAQGMTRAQKAVFVSLLPDELEFHHGDCIGADEDAHHLVRQTCLVSKIVIHPPTLEVKRAFCQGNIILPVKDYLPRNHDIVDSVREMIATPKGFKEELRSGTWATIRQAKRVGIRCTIIWPDGTKGFYRG